MLGNTILEEYLIKDEGKTLEFKENTKFLKKIVQTIIAFANTAGGTLIVGIKDKTKEVVGLDNILQDEEKIANAISDLVLPLLIPTMHKYTWRERDVLIIQVSHHFGPYYIKADGIEHSVYMRLGSTNRVADHHTILEIQQHREHKPFDEQLNLQCPLSEIQFDVAQSLFEKVSKKYTLQTGLSLGLIVPWQGKTFPSNGAVLLFGKEHYRYLPEKKCVMRAYW